jgi:hypothetical protein
MSSDWLSLCLQTFGFLVVCILSLYITRTGIALIVAIIIMLVINFVAQVLIAGEGPGACVGLVALPYLGCIVVLVTQKIQNIYHSRR